MKVVRAQIGPQIKLQKSSEDRKAEEWGATFAAVTTLAIIAGALAVLALLPESVVPVFWYLRDWSPLLGLGSAALVLLSIAAGFARRRAERTARTRHAASVRALLEAAFHGAQRALQKRRQKQGMPLDQHNQRGTFAPDPMRLGVTPRGAEELVAQWMRHLGEASASVTAFTGDGGVDVVGARYIAQVKHFTSNVGVAPIRELAGVAATDGRGPLFFTSTGYAPGAVEFADRAGVALFVYSAERRELLGMNGRAKTLMIHGLG
ncbi:hypothetical protein ASG80_12455 [Agromyces sp. Soil535]|nr:hypothetical protein ASG80_12455 [Agromyces sp. Soil535]